MVTETICGPYKLPSLTSGSAGLFKKILVGHAQSYVITMHREMDEVAE